MPNHHLLAGHVVFVERYILGRRMGGQVLPGSLPAEGRQRRHAGKPAQLAVEAGQRPEMPGVVPRLDSNQLPVLARVAQHRLPFADGGQADGLAAMRKDRQPDVVIAVRARQVGGKPVRALARTCGVGGG
jgi:hypothetical protein